MYRVLRVQCAIQRFKNASVMKIGFIWNANLSSKICRPPTLSFSKQNAKKQKSADVVSSHQQCGQYTSANSRSGAHVQLFAFFRFFTNPSSPVNLRRTLFGNFRFTRRGQGKILRTKVSFFLNYNNEIPPIVSR